MEIAFYKDRFIDINDPIVPLEDRGHQFGDGVYEVIRTYGGKPFMLTAHLERLARSAEATRIKLPYPLEEIRSLILSSFDRSELLEAEIYLHITRGASARKHLFPEGESTLTITVRPPRPMAPEKVAGGIGVLLCDDERWANCYIKSLNLLPNILAKQMAFDQGFDEAVFVKDGLITEGASSNVFAVREGKLITPPKSKRILHGITRQVILDLAAKVGIETREVDIPASLFKETDEAFVTSTGQEILPVKRINDQFVAAPGPLTAKVMAEFRRLTGGK